LTTNLFCSKLRTMEEWLKDLVHKFEQIIDSENERRKIDGLDPHQQLEVTILGQFSLFLHPEIAQALNPTATLDLDAWVKGAAVPRSIFERLVREAGFKYDDKSEFIWVPDESKYKIIYQSPLLLCKAIDPFYALVSKAVKAPEKNRILLQNAISYYGEELIACIEKYGGDLELITGEKD